MLAYLSKIDTKHINSVFSAHTNVCLITYFFASLQMQSLMKNLPGHTNQNLVQNSLLTLLWKEAVAPQMKSEINRQL